MRCPLDQSILQKHEEGEAQIFYCETCHGLWLSREQLSRFLRNPAVATALPKVKVFSGKHVDFTSPRLCPLCKSAALFTKAVDGVEIDLCSRCHGIWLDAGELDLIIKRYQRKKKLANVADNAVDLIADAPTDLSFLSDLTESIAEVLGHGSEWAADAGPALLEFIGDIFSSLDF